MLLTAMTMKMMMVIRLREGRAPQSWWWWKVGFASMQRSVKTLNIVKRNLLILESFLLDSALRMKLYKRIIVLDCLIGYSSRSFKESKMRRVSSLNSCYAAINAVLISGKWIRVLLLKLMIWLTVLFRWDSVGTLRKINISDANECLCITLTI